MLFIFVLIAMLSVALTRGVPFKERVTLFSRGAGNTDLLLMVWIFMLAGAFAASAKAMGAAGAMVDLTLDILPARFALTGLFVAACVTSLCMGTSVGTIVALMPIAAGLADKTEMELPLVAAAVVGGAFFGDNLSFISDTTIVATQSQGCRLRDKFIFNIRMVLPAALNGVMGMSELILISLLAGGIFALIRYNGGLDYMTNLITRRVKTRAGAEWSICGLVAFANICTANNTIAILSVGDMARHIAERFEIDPRRSASLLDTTSCCVQGILPYGAQLLMASGLAGISALSIVPYLFYPALLGVTVIVTIYIQRNTNP